MASSTAAGKTQNRATVTTKRKRGHSDSNEDMDKSWREILGPPPPLGTTHKEREIWLSYHKRKWAIQMKQRVGRRTRNGDKDSGPVNVAPGAGVMRSNVGGFLRKVQQTLLNSLWQILQVNLSISCIP